MQQMIDALLEERFTNAWRESASDLATLIREAAPGTGPVLVQPRTMITDRPVTIVTRSLISSTQKTPPPAQEPAAPDAAAWAAPIPRAPSPVAIVRDADSAQDTFEAPSPNGRPSMPMMPGAESGARTSHGWLDPQLMTAPELASVHGGATVTASGQIAIEPARSSKWTFGILGVAALIGVSAALAIQMAPGGMSERAEAAPPKQPAVQPEQVKVAVVPVPVPEPVVEAAPVVATPPPAPEPVAQPAVVEQPKPVVVKKARPAPVVKKPAAPDATLRVITDEGTWAKVIIGSEAQEAPGAKFHLAAGTYTVRLRNSDLDIAMACQVSLEAGKVKTLRVALEDKQCYGE
jgi:hypothetical protein